MNSQRKTRMESRSALSRFHKLIVFASGLMIGGSSVVADTYYDFGIVSMNVTPTTIGSYLITMELEVVPGVAMPTGAIGYQFVASSSGNIGGGDTGSFTALGSCCATSTDCGGHPCGINNDCGEPGKPWYCYRRPSITFSTNQVAPGETITATLDPNAQHTETGSPGAGNNVMIAIVPPSYNRTLEQIQFTPSGPPGSYDVSFTAIYQHISDGSVEIPIGTRYDLFINNVFSEISINRGASIPAGLPVYTCWTATFPNCSGTCEPTVWDNPGITYECTDKNEKCTCWTFGPKSYNSSFPLVPGDQVRVCLVPLPGTMPEVDTSDDCVTVTFFLPGTPAMSTWGLIFSLGVVVCVGVVVSKRARAWPTG